MHKTISAALASLALVLLLLPGPARAEEEAGGLFAALAEVWEEPLLALLPGAAEGCPGAPVAADDPETGPAEAQILAVLRDGWRLLAVVWVRGGCGLTVWEPGEAVRETLQPLDAMPLPDAFSPVSETDAALAARWREAAARGEPLGLAVHETGPDGTLSLEGTPLPEPTLRAAGIGEDRYFLLAAEAGEEAAGSPEGGCTVSAGMCHRVTWLYSDGSVCFADTEERPLMPAETLIPQPGGGRPGEDSPGGDAW